jgi:hypothetical protein
MTGRCRTTRFSGPAGSVFSEAGFTRFRRATQTPFNLILEARK